MNLLNKTAIVTGASRGLGASISKLLVDKGVRVFGIARSANDLQVLKQHLGERFVPIVMDLRNRTEIEQFVKNTFDETQGPEILINNAGFGFWGNVEETPPETWDDMMAVNLTSVYDFTRLIVPLMKSNPETCHIVNISSVAGLMGNPGLTAYNASKYALRGFSDALMKEVRKDGIKVTCLFPGSIETSFFDKLDMKGSANKLHPDEVAELIVFLIETSSNFLVDEITLRPLIPN